MSTERVEVEDTLLPSGAGQPGRPFRRDVDASGFGLHAVDRLQAHLHAAGQEHAARANHVIGAIQAKGDEQQARLVDVLIVAIDDGDSPRIGQRPRQPVCHLLRGGTGPTRSEEPSARRSVTSTAHSAGLCAHQGLTAQVLRDFANSTCSLAARHRNPALQLVHQFSGRFGDRHAGFGCIPVDQRRGDQAPTLRRQQV